MSPISQEKALQYEMHKDFFDRCRFAIDNGMYFEDMLMEYASIESRLEVIMGVIGLPCNKGLPDTERRKILISDRIKCLKTVSQTSDGFSSSKLSKGFFTKLEKWIAERNKYIHGLYKNEMEYKNRMKNISGVATRGYEICGELYREAKRLRRLNHNSNMPTIEFPCIKTNCSYKNKNHLG